MFRNIVLHWTGGNYTPCSVDIEHYHYLIDGKGNIKTGKYEPLDNLNCTDGKYAAHCGGGNTGRIGVAICCCKDNNTLPTKVQVEAMCNLVARLCFAYGLQPSQCITHAEFGQKNKKSTSYGKIDITYLPYAQIQGIKATGDYLRNKIQWYFNQLTEV